MATFVGIALGDPNFSILVKTLQFIDANKEGSALVATLNDPHQELTVFAPTNAAFGALASDLGFTGDAADENAVVGFLTTLDVELLNTVVTYHVAGGALTAADIAAAGTVATLQGGVITANELPTLTDLEPDLINPSLIATDIAADNGVLHVIDRVLIPADLPGNDAPSITEIVAASGGVFDDNAADFDILLTAVKTADLAGVLNNPDADLTAFAPTDAAFVGLAQDVGYHGNDEGEAWVYLVDALTVLGGGDPVPLLTEILTYHVAGTSLQASQVLGSDTIATLQGGELGVDGASLVDADPDVANPNLIATDIQASNGVVHVLDGVLLPIDVLAGPGSDLKIGDDGRDTVFTGFGDDFVNSKAGNDFVSLGFGDDVALAGAGRDIVHGGFGNDLIDGQEGNDRISGGFGDDMLKGGAGRDKISGGFGDDVINGGAGRDKLAGGFGDDIFVFTEGDGRDVIRDFNLHDDLIDLTSFGFDGIEDLDIRDKGRSTEIDLGDGDMVQLRFTDADHLTADQFLF